MWTLVYQGGQDGKTGVNVRLLCRDKTKVFKPGQTHMFNDEVEVCEGGCRFVHVCNVKSVLVERPNRRPFMHMNVLNPQLPAFFQISIGPGVTQLPSLG